jgi:beta-lactam-binding protein with PASTA domain
VREVPDDQYPPGYVVRQTPTAGTRASPALPVVLDVANGQSVSVTVPDVLGMDEQLATRVLTESGLVPAIVREAEPPSPGLEQRAGLAWKQRPAAGTVTRSGSTVEVRVNP